MTTQEKIEILKGVKDHPNKEKLTFKIDGEWVSYLDLENNIGEEVYLSDSTLINMKLNSKEVEQKYEFVYDWDMSTSNQDDFLIIEREDKDSDILKEGIAFDMRKVIKDIFGKITK